MHRFVAEARILIVAGDGSLFCNAAHPSRLRHGKYLRSYTRASSCGRRERFPHLRLKLPLSFSGAISACDPMRAKRNRYLVAPAQGRPEPTQEAGKRHSCRKRPRPQSGEERNCTSNQKVSPGRANSRTNSIVTDSVHHMMKLISASMLLFVRRLMRRA